MSVKFQMIKPQEKSLVNIRVVGVGGGGGNAVNHMMESRKGTMEFIAVNTDSQILERSAADVKLHIGGKLTGGRGAGGRPEIGLRAAEESRGDIQSALEGSNMVFVTAGMGGGTGTGAAPVIAQISRDLGILTVGVVTKPFLFEGAHRMDQAEVGIASLRQYVDALMVIPNEQLKTLHAEGGEPITFKNAFRVADEVLSSSVQSICDLIEIEGTINLDFNDVTAVMQGAGMAHMGVGEATGKDMTKDLVEQSCTSKLLQTSIKGAKRVLVNLICSEDAALDDVYDVMSRVQEQASPGANIIFGQTFDNTLKDKMKITVIAAGFDGDDEFELPSDTFNAKDKNEGGKATEDASEKAAPESEDKQGFIHSDWLDDSLLGIFESRKDH